MKILITGASGKLGQRLVRELSPDHEVRGLSRLELDIGSAPEVMACVRGLRPAAILNAAAFTAVDRCEDEPEPATLINSSAVRHLALAATEAGARLVHFSTDFVFDGERSGPPYREDDTPNPLSVYGQTKLAGESEALAYCDRALVLRLSWVYGAGGWNFTDWVAREIREGREIRIVTDQIGTPTWTGDVARQVRRLLEVSATGLFHSAGQGECSRLEWAHAILHAAGLPTARVIPIASMDLVQKAPRPRYSALDNERLRVQDLNDMRPWREALHEHLSEAAT